MSKCNIKFLKYSIAFSLIELMVVIAVIGILVAVAIPLYQDYTTRGKVVEVISLAKKSLTDWENAYTTNQAFPSATGPLGKYVQTIVSNSSGVVVTINNPSNIETSVNGVVITYTPDVTQGAISWNCAAATVTAGGTTYTTNNTYAPSWVTPTNISNGLYRHPHQGGGSTSTADPAATTLFCSGM